MSESLSDYIISHAGIRYETFGRLVAAHFINMVLVLYWTPDSLSAPLTEESPMPVQV